MLTNLLYIDDFVIGWWYIISLNFWYMDYLLVIFSCSSGFDACGCVCLWKQRILVWPSRLNDILTQYNEQLLISSGTGINWYCKFQTYLLNSQQAQQYHYHILWSDKVSYKGLVLQFLSISNLAWLHVLMQILKFNPRVHHWWGA